CSFNVEASLDFGASVYFLDTILVQQAHIPTIEINPPLSIKVVDG
ncbi:15899_t:CDS:1, partial [Gigaspora margarita]